MRRRATSLLLLLLAGALALAPARARHLPQHEDGQDSPIVINSEVVLVNMVVTSGDAYAHGLAASDFEVAEDGTPQKVEFFGAEQTPFAAAILLDTSGSMEMKLRLARVAAARFMDRARPEDRVAVYLFGSDVKRLQDFTPGGRDLDDALWDTSAKGITKMFDCVGQAADALDARSEPRRAILLLSDGADYGSSATIDAALKRADAAGVTIYTVDLAPIGGGAQVLSSAEDMQARSALKKLADKTGGRFFASKGGDDLNTSFAQIIDEISHQYTVGYYPSNTKHDGTYRKISVTPKRPGLKLRARPGYTAPSQ
jgi:VWFA-related protein